MNCTRVRSGEPKFIIVRLRRAEGGGFSSLSYLVCNMKNSEEGETAISRRTQKC